MFTTVWRILSPFVLGVMQNLIYGDKDAIKAFLAAKGWLDPAGNLLPIPPDKIDDFLKDCFKAVCDVLRKSLPF